MNGAGQLAQGRQKGTESGGIIGIITFREYRMRTEVEGEFRDIQTEVGREVNGVLFLVIRAGES